MGRGKLSIPHMPAGLSRRFPLCPGVAVSGPSMRFLTSGVKPLLMSVSTEGMAKGWLRLVRHGVCYGCPGASE
jgi:hypothetical protein